MPLINQCEYRDKGSKVVKRVSSVQNVSIINIDSVIFTVNLNIIRFIRL
jgi:hypothetical protein